MRSRTGTEDRHFLKAQHQALFRAGQDGYRERGLIVLHIRKSGGRPELYVSLTSMEKEKNDRDGEVEMFSHPDFHKMLTLEKVFYIRKLL
jgi:hypothetical protein